MERCIDELEYSSQIKNNLLEGKEVELKQLKIQLLYLQKQTEQKNRKDRGSSVYLPRKTPKWAEKEDLSMKSVDDEAFKKEK